MPRLCTIRILLVCACLLPALFVRAESALSYQVTDIACVISKVAEGEGKTREVTVDRGAADGLVVGWRGTLYTPISSTKVRSRLEIGRAEVLHTNDLQATMRVTMPTPTGETLVREGDIVIVRARVPVLPQRSVLWNAARYHFDLVDSFTKTPYCDYRRLYAGETTDYVEGIYAAMVADLQKTAKEYAELDFMKQPLTGRYQGSTACDVLSHATRDDVVAFLRYVTSDPSTYCGVTKEFNGAFASWVLDGAFPSEEELADQLLAAPTPVARTAIVMRYKDYILRYRAVLDWLDYADTLSDTPGQTDRALQLVTIATEVAKQLNLPTALWWSDYTRGSILETVGRYPEALTAFSTAITNMRTVTPATAESRRVLGTAILHKASVLIQLDRYPEAIACCAEAMKTAEPSAYLRIRLLGRWGAALIQLSRYKDARAKYQEMSTLCQDADDSNNLGHALMWSAYAASRLGDNVDAMATYQRVLALYRQEGNRAGEAEILAKIGSQLWSLGNYQDALARNLEALAIRRELDDQPGIATSLTAIGKLYWNIGKYDLSKDAHSEALRLRVAQGDLPGQAESLDELGDLSRNSGEYPLALQHYEDALALYRKLADLSGQAYVLAQEGRVYKEQVKYTEALEVYRQAIALCSKIGDQTALANVLSARGAVYDAMKDYPNALSAYQEALTTQRAIGAKSDQAETLCNIGNIQSYQQAYSAADASFTAALNLATALGDRTREAYIYQTLGRLSGCQFKFTPALAHLQQALTIYSSEQCNDVNEQGETHLLIGDDYYTQGDFPHAREHYDIALRLARQCHERSLEVRTNNSIAWLLRSQGKSEEALACYQQTLALAEELNDDWLCGSTYHTIAVLYSDVGDNQQALTYEGKALAIYEKIGHGYGRATALTAFGVYYFRQGDYEQCRKYLLEALNIGEKLGSREYLVTVLTDLGELDAQQHDYTTGMPYLQRALAISREAGTKPEIVGALIILGETSREKGEALTKKGDAANAAKAYTEAEQYLSNANTLAGALGAPGLTIDILSEQGRLATDRRQYPVAQARLQEAERQATAINALHRLWSVRYYLCLAYEAQGKLPEAEAACRQSIAVLDALRARAGGGDKGKETFLRSKIQVYEQMAELLGRINAKEADPVVRARRAEEAQQFIALARFQVLQETTREVPVTTGNAAVDASLQRYQTVLHSQEQLTQEKQDALSAGNLEKATRLDKVLAGNEDELSSLFVDIKAADADLDARLKFDPRRLTDSVHDLPAHTTLLAFFPGQDSLHIWVYTNAGFQEWRQVDVKREQINALIQRYRLQINDVITHLERHERMGKGFGQEAEQDVNNPEWYRTNSAELRQVLSQLYGALLKPVEGDLAQSEQVLILPYGQLCYLPFEALIDEKGVFANERWRFAYVISEDHLRDTLQTLTVPHSQNGDTWVAFADPRGRLGSSLEEAHEIADLFPQHEIHSKETGDATADTVRQLRPDCTILHFATHGLLNGERPSQTYLEMATPPGDGTLTQKDVYLLKGRVPSFKQHTLRLVMLSACETALAQNSPEAEVLGMPDAFTMAGAQAVIASLWSVYTYTTSDFMVEFYQRYAKEGHEKSLALQEAKTQLLRGDNGRYAHPFYWAPFILFGNWR